MSADTTLVASAHPQDECIVVELLPNLGEPPSRVSADISGMIADAHRGTERQLKIRVPVTAAISIAICMVYQNEAAAGFRNRPLDLDRRRSTFRQ